MKGAHLSGCVVTRAGNGYLIMPVVPGSQATMADATVVTSLREVTEWLADHLPLAPVGPVRGDSA